MSILGTGLANEFLMSPKVHLHRKSSCVPFVSQLGCHYVEGDQSSWVRKIAKNRNPFRPKSGPEFSEIRLNLPDFKSVC